MQQERCNQRAAFTAIEILIVVAIIALLMSIAAGAIVRVKAASERGATETTLTKLASILDRHWKATIDAAKKEYDGLPTTIKQNLIKLADNDPTAAGYTPQPRRDDRARLLFVKFRLKQEFPASFNEAMDPDPTFGMFLPALGLGQYLQGNPAAMAAFASRQVAGNQPPATGKAAYVKFIVDYYSKVNTPKNVGLNWGNRAQYPKPQFQSAILLAMALEQARGGVAPANLEQEIGTSFVATTQQFLSPSNDMVGMPRLLVDTWGNPLQLYIFPTYDIGANPGTTDLDLTLQVPNPKKLSDMLQSGTSADPQDPEGLLLDSTISNWKPPTAMNNFLPHRQIVPQLVGTSPIGKVYRLRRMLPIIASAGPDGDLGGNFAATDPKMALPAAASFDNIYSFRLRQTGAKGD